MPLTQFQTKKKPVFPVSARLRSYLGRYNRERPLPTSYSRLLDWHDSTPLYDHDGADTLWQTVVYAPEDWKTLERELTAIYAILKTEGDSSFMNQLYADRVDYCTFGNTNPFRVRIVNAYNENQDYYYIKRGDASRVYGLELEHMLSPNLMHYLTSRDTLVEEHVVGIPGDVFIEKWLRNPNFKPVRLAKELVKFNERCFVRLLGDMRSYNFVIELTSDFEEVQTRIRAMDFDQQCYSGRKNFYLPQYFKDNYPLVEFCLEHINIQTSRQYQKEEHAVIHRRMKTWGPRVQRLIECMRADRISPDEKIITLRESLHEHYGDERFHLCRRMGDILNVSLQLIAERATPMRSPLGED